MMTSLFNFLLESSANYFFKLFALIIRVRLDLFLSSECLIVFQPALREFFSRPYLCKPDGECVNRLWDVFKNNHHRTWTILSSIISSRRSHQIVRCFQEWPSQSPGPSSPPWSHREDPQAPPLWLPPPPGWGSGCWFAPSVSMLKKASNMSATASISQ